METSISGHAFVLAGGCPGDRTRGCRLFALQVFGSSTGAVDHLITVGVAVLVGLVLWAARLGWNYLRAPIKQLEEDVAAIRVDLSRIVSVIIHPSRGNLLPTDWLGVLRPLRSELDRGQDFLARANASHTYWKLMEGGPTDTTWKRYRDRLSREVGLGDLYFQLSEAYDEIKRIRQLRAPRWRNAEVRPEDNLRDALLAVEQAVRALDEKIEALDRPQLPGTTNE